MKHGFRNQVHLKASTGLRVDPKIVLASQVLQLSQPDLEQLVESELMENPALERIDGLDDPVSHEEILRTVAPRELKPSGENYEAVRSIPNDSWSDSDWVDLTSSCDTLWDHLRAQLHAALPREFWGLGDYLAASVNDRGYLTCTVEDAALDCGCSLEQAEIGVRALQSCEPAGVGATDLRECLILQLRHAETDAEKLAKIMLKNCWDDLVARNARAICRKYTVPQELVEEAFEVILTLNPFPGESFSTHSVRPSSERSAPAMPDVVVSLDEIGWLIEVPGPSALSLRISRTYESRHAELGKKLAAPQDEKRHVGELVVRAGRFLEALSQRRRLLASVGKYLVENQGGFVKTGEYRFLGALTRSKMAQDLGVHESTISRATNGKFIQIATREVVPFDVFFKPALRVQKMIEEILQNENPESPLSDERIAQILAERGVKVARRTVNKYRDRTKLLSSRRRRAA